MVTAIQTLIFLSILSMAYLLVKKSVQLIDMYFYKNSVKYQLGEKWGNLYDDEFAESFYKNSKSASACAYALINQKIGL